MVSKCSVNGTESVRGRTVLRMRDAQVKLLSKLHTFAFQATRGVVGRRLVDNDMLLLTTTGRRTGKPHTVPLLYLTEGERFVVIASYGGRPDDPEWYRNLVVDPAARIQVEGRHIDVVAETMDDDTRDEWWPRIVDAYDGYATYQGRTGRRIPVVWLTPSTDS